MPGSDDPIQAAIARQKIEAAKRRIAGGAAPAAAERLTPSGVPVSAAREIRDSIFGTPQMEAAAKDRRDLLNSLVPFPDRMYDENNPEQVDKVLVGLARSRGAINRDATPDEAEYMLRTQLGNEAELDRRRREGAGGVAIAALNVLGRPIRGLTRGLVDPAETLPPEARRAMRSQEAASLPLRVAAQGAELVGAIPAIGRGGVKGLARYSAETAAVAGEDPAKAYREGALFGGLAAGISAPLKAFLSKFDAVTQNAIVSRMSAAGTGALSFAGADAILHGPDGERALTNAILGAGLSLAGGDRVGAPRSKHPTEAQKPVEATPAEAISAPEIPARSEVLGGEAPGTQIRAGDALPPDNPLVKMADLNRRREASARVEMEQYRTSEDVEAAIGGLDARYRGVEDAILGADAVAWRKAQSQSNRSDPDVAERGLAEVKRIESRLSPADVDRLYGAGEIRMGPDDLKALRDELQAVESAESPGTLGQRLAFQMERATSSGEGLQSNIHRRAVARGLDVARENGWDVEDVGRRTIDAFRHRYRDLDPTDATDLLSSVMEGFGAKRGPLPTEANPALGARPAEVPVQREPLPTEAPRDVTSLKRRIVDEERAARGLGPSERGPVITDEMARAEAERIVAENPNEPARLLVELAESARAPNKIEEAVLLRHRRTLYNEYDATAKRSFDAADFGDKATAAEAAARAEKVGDDLIALENVVGPARTRAGQSLQGLKAEMLPDYSLAAMVTRRRVARQGQALTPEQMAETKALHDRIAKAEKDVAARDARIAELEVRRAVGRSPRAAPGTPEYGRSNKIVTRESYEATKAELRDIFSTRLSASVGVIDPAVLAKVVKMGVYHVEAGARSFASWSKAMLSDFGEGVRPHLRGVWDDARAQLRDQGFFDAQSLRAAKTRTLGQTETMESRVATGNLKPPPRRAVKPDAEMIRLQANLDVAKGRFNQALFRDKLANRTKAQKAFAAVGETSAVARAIMTGLDVSAVLRQNLVATLARPITAAKQLGPMFKAFASPTHQARSEAELRKRPTYLRNKRAGLFQAEHGVTSLSKMEEAYMTRWLDPLAMKPGQTGRNIARGAFNAITFPFAGSARAFHTFSNRMRMETMDAMAAGFSKGAEPTPAELRAIAHATNVFTGRGGPSNPKAANTLAGLNYVLFSPRLLASRFQTLLGTPLYGGSMRTRKIIAGEYARFLGSAAVLYGLAKLAGASVEDDARSADFGKIRYGETRLDPMGGLLQVTVLGDRVIGGEEVDKAGKAHKAGFDTLARFLRTKLAPIPGAAIDAKFGKTVSGQPATVGSAAAGLVTPMSIGDILDAMEEQGVPRGPALSILSLFGMGLQTYKPTPKPPRRSTGR